MQPVPAHQNISAMAITLRRLNSRLNEAVTLPGFYACQFQCVEWIEYFFRSTVTGITIPSANLLHVRRLVLFAVFRIFNRYDFAGPSVLSQQGKSVAQDFPLQIPHAGTAEAVANLKSFRIERTRRAHLRRDFRADSYQHRWDAFHFDFPLDRDDRAVANVWSTAGQHYRVGPRAFVDVVGDFARRAFVHRFELHRVAHVADVLFGNAADESFALQSAQHFNRKDDVDVFVGVAMVVVMMRDHQVFHIDIRRNFAVTEIAEFVGDVECFLILQVNTAGGNDCDRAFRQFTIERREGNALA